ncbi:hypothetical protein ACHAPQ_008316 [Fusarium lateritium]
MKTVLSSLPEHDVRKRSLELCLFNFIWIDVLATSTFGAMSYCPCAFDYLPLLESGVIKSEDFMGCQHRVFAIVSKIARLEELELMDQSQIREDTFRPQLRRRRSELEQELDSIIRTIQGDIEGLINANAGHDLDAAMISLIWAYGAKVLFQVTLPPIASEQIGIDQNFVDICLEKLETLPTRLVMRTSWPYTIAGSMATSESQHQRFRGILDKVLQEAQPPGIAWKGLIVMEECWRLRRMNQHGNFGWREAMESLGARVILT